MLLTPPDSLENEAVRRHAWKPEGTGVALEAYVSRARGTDDDPVQKSLRYFVGSEYNRWLLKPRRLCGTRISMACEDGTAVCIP